MEPIVEDRGEPLIAEDRAPIVEDRGEPLIAEDRVPIVEDRGEPIAEDREEPPIETISVCIVFILYQVFILKYYIYFCLY